ncbi:MAG: hypothetical protein JSS67_06570 [Bacteroidetes bacterium]|nr:hypothetical protein [Bacteroidota bacterium]
MFKSHPFPLKLVLKCGLFIGILDILAAFIDYFIATGKGPEGVLKFIASGVFGMDAFSGGTGMILCGLLFHFIIAYAFTIFFFWLYPRVRLASHQPVLFVVIYALFMWAVTHLVIMPLSKVPLENRIDLQFWKIIKANLILLFMICLPLTLIARRYFKKEA